MSTPLKVLFVEDPAFDVDLIVEELRRGGFAPTWARVHSAGALRALLLAPGWQVILSGSSMPHLDALLAVAKELVPDIPFIVVSGTIDEDTAVKAIRAGAADFVIKDNLPRLSPAISRALQQGEARRARRLAAEAERGWEQSFRRLIENLPVGVLVHRDRRILYANPTCLRYLGVERMEDLIGRDPLSMVVPEDRAQIGERLLRVAVGQTVPPMETEIRGADGKTLAVELVGFRLDVDGAPAIVTVARDIGREREMQKQLMLADRMISIGTLAAGVAHEINNPLAYIQGNLEFALDRLGSVPGPEVMGEVREALQEAREGTGRVRLIVRGLKTFSRPDERNTGPVDVRPILESAINMAFNEIRYRAQLVKDYRPTPLVAGNGARLGQVFLNLLVNAAQAITEGAAEKNEIRVSTSTDEAGRALVAIRDTGIGIAPELQRRIFDPFFTTKPIGVGTGFGLAISQSIVAALGGEIAVRSEPGQGSEFRVTLPPAGPQISPVLAEQAPGRDVRRGTILVLDDDEMVGNVIRRVLAEHDVKVARSGGAALAELAAGARYDLILCDLMMPEVSGMDVHAELTRIDPAQARRMIFLSGGTYTAAAQQFLERVTNLRVEKPFNAADLRALVRNQLG